MDDNQLEVQVEKLISIIEYLNEIRRLIISKEIIDGTTLTKDSDTFHSISSRAQKIYEITTTCLFIGDRDKYRTARAELSHIQETLDRKDCMGGFDTIPYDDLWAHHFGPKGHLDKVSSSIENALERNEKIKNEIARQRSSQLKQPIKLLTTNDLSHYKIIAQITDPISSGVICFTALLTLYSANRNPPSKQEIFGAVCKIHPLTEEQFEFILSQLEEKRIIKRSLNKNILFIVDEEFCKKTTVDFLDKYDIAKITKILGDQT
jgi:hypothetical protein